MILHITANFAWNFANLRLKIHFKLSCRSNSCSKVRGILPHTTKYFTKVHADQNNRRREKLMKNRELSKRFLFKRNIVEKREFRWSSFALLFHNTVNTQWYEIRFSENLQYKLFFNDWLWKAGRLTLNKCLWTDVNKYWCLTNDLSRS